MQGFLMTTTVIRLKNVCCKIKIDSLIHLTKNFLTQTILTSSTLYSQCLKMHWLVEVVLKKIYDDQVLKKMCKLVFSAVLPL